MELLAIRVDAISEATKDLLESWLKEHSSKYLIYEEIGAMTKKLHYQGCVELDLGIKNIDAWRKNVKDLIKPTEKNQYSLAKIKKAGKYLVYITKDKKKIISSGYTDEEIEHLESQSYPKDDRSKQSFTEKLYQKVKEELVDYYMNYNGKKIMKALDRSKLVKMVIKEFCNNTKVFDRMVIMRCATMIENKLLLESIGDVNDELVQKIVEDMI